MCETYPMLLPIISKHNWDLTSYHLMFKPKNRFPSSDFNTDKEGAFTNQVIAQYQWFNMKNE